jgi:DNA-binding MarR family transcriptional regulator
MKQSLEQVEMKRNKGATLANGSSALQEKALRLIGRESHGLLQSELRRLLGINSSRCSRVVSKLESAGLVWRERVSTNRSYLIRLNQENIAVAPKLHIDRYLTEIYLLYLIRVSIC